MNVLPSNQRRVLNDKGEAAVVGSVDIEVVAGAEVDVTAKLAAVKTCRAAAEEAFWFGRVLGATDVREAVVADPWRTG